MMTLYHAPTSPFVRKVMVFAHELGLADRIEIVPAGANPVDRNAELRPIGPLAQVPLLVDDEGEAIFDSRVICEHLNDLGGGLLFGAGRGRIRLLTQAALADGLLGAALLTRYETTLRPEERRWTAWVHGQMEKIADALDRFEKQADDFGQRVDIATISVACALGYLDFRFASYDWRSGQPKLAAWFAHFDERPALTKTRPHA